MPGGPYGALCQAPLTLKGGARAPSAPPWGGPCCYYYYYYYYYYHYHYWDGKKDHLHSLTNCFIRIIRFWIIRRRDPSSGSVLKIRHPVSVLVFCRSYRWFRIWWFWWNSLLRNVSDLFFHFSTTSSVIWLWALFLLLE